MVDDALVEALRAQGAERADPVRFRLVEAMARRTAAQQGEARRLLEARLAELVAGFTTPPAPTQPAAAPGRPAPGPLASLLVPLGDRSGRPSATRLPAGQPAGHGPAPASAAGEPPALDYFRATWSRLQTEQRLAQSQARLPGNAGPLNSQHLVHRALMLMHELSPGYLQHFMGQVDALLWLDGVSEAAGGPNGGRA
jgi:hypothetical protein